MREFKELGYDRWREERGYGVRWLVESLFSAVKRTFGESVGATSFLGQVVEAKLKFWAYAWMMYMANSVVGRAPGVRM
ncbi:hypothetical protein MetMK1DRAFT_00003380 [Metallosphaera yellowstonensis MK1]|uniref:Transposase ISC1058 n=1 Tax=Metallosphaera yellowstonensis MK1 TaxID=671065 RepID=H2C4P4_9CREN|nr:hypothetical protein MetMK1DRAFT_00003380 [Metallosphaera yellowstonensis MK1]